MNWKTFMFVSFWTNFCEAFDCFCVDKVQIIISCDCIKDPRVTSIDEFNNDLLFRKLKDVLERSYFRYFSYDGHQKCKFLDIVKDYDLLSSSCQNEACSIKICDKNTVPAAFLDECFRSQVDNTISDSVRSELSSWKNYDDKLNSLICHPDDFCPVCDYVDLTLNPETFTGYSGPSAQKVWKAIYNENCFSSNFIDASYENFIEGLCLEKRVFFRALSGLHSSISIHLSAQYPMMSRLLHYGPNVQEFNRRFAHEWGQHWLKNLYYLYLLELQALNSVSEYLKLHHYHTADDIEDNITKDMIKDILEIVTSFNNNNNPLFADDKDKKQIPLIEEFQQHFHNISQIMNCVGCDKCKLWGKLQISGLGTAFKVLFGKQFQLKRNEIVALFNSLGRLSTSIYQLSIFREMQKIDL